ncbi:MAG: 30S ribosomal protein S4 [bacterium]|nr:30S ribosomal protein S4 [bacterium]
MARYRDAVCKLCRRERIKLFLKGDRCYSDKCAVEKKPYAPGQHGPTARRAKHSEFGIQLREKQKVKRLYGLLEKQFRLTYSKAEGRKGKTGEVLLIMLEQRLDNSVYRMGFARSLAEARQLVKHNHVLVNGRKCNIPSAQVKKNDVLSIREKSRAIASIKEAGEAAQRKGLVPGWLAVDHNAFEGKVVDAPTREQIVVPIQEQLIVELYSR